ncbi:MAG: hypothetical protein A2Z49_03425 [Chloroflexi bacterium RBG_19FT_COMBO_56_12]|nr:MAG: hypothetical protein A2Z49_03425 [Chloroflexi bacterium RBG_19FT_COMBO_56_12]
MSRISKKHRLGHPFDLPPRWRWFLWPVIVLSGGGTVVSLWLEEGTAAMAECAPVAALPGLAALLYWFNHCVFKAAVPRPEELSASHTDKHNSPTGKE